MPATQSDQADAHVESRTAVLYRACSRPSLQGDGPPTQYPCRPLDDVLAQMAAAAEASPPLADLDDLPQLASLIRSRPLLRRVVELLVDRVDAAYREGLIRFDRDPLDAFAGFLCAILPDQFEVPPYPARPTATAPKTGDRELVYAARCRRAVALFHVADRNGQDPADALAVAWGDGRAPRVKEWVRRPDRNRKRSGTFPGVKPKPKAKKKGRSPCSG